MPLSALAASDDTRQQGLFVPALIAGDRRFRVALDRFAPVDNVARAMLEEEDG